jgi:hypothetical protein
MRHEAAGIGIGGRRGSHVEIKRGDVAIQPLQQLETVIPPVEPVRRAQRYCSALCRSRDFARQRKQQDEARRRRDAELHGLAQAVTQAAEALARRLADPT